MATEPTYYLTRAGALVLVEPHGRAHIFEGGCWHRADHLAITLTTRAAAEAQYPKAFALDVAETGEAAATRERNRRASRTHASGG